MATSTLAASEKQTIAQEIMRVGRKLAECRFHDALAGNISVRLGEDKLICTCTGADKAALDDEQLVVCNLQGEVLEGTGRPTSEMLMHLAAYKARPDVRAVIHAHPPTATAFAAASKPLDTLCLPEILVWLGPIAFVPYGTPGTQELTARLQPFLAGHDGFLLENHGALSLGHTLRKAAQRMELIEQTARITLTVGQLGKKPYVLTERHLAELVAIRANVNIGKR